MEKRYFSDNDKEIVSKKQTEVLSKKVMIADLYVTFLEFVPGNEKSVLLKTELDKEVLNLSKLEKDFNILFVETLKKYDVDVNDPNHKWEFNFVEMSFIEIDG